MQRKSKKLLRLITAICLMCMLVAALSTVAYARASYYLSSYSGCVSKEGNTVYVDFNVCGTHAWENIGALSIRVYKEDGTWVKTFLHESTPGMLSHNTAFGSGYVSFTGNANTRYKAYICAYAGPGDDGDSRYFWVFEN